MFACTYLPRDLAVKVVFSVIIIIIIIIILVVKAAPARALGLEGKPCRAGRLATTRHGGGLHSVRGCG